jgi:hypothetical protein
MAKNDLFLVDAIFDDYRKKNCAGLDQGEAFERFSLQQLLQEDDLDLEQLLEGIVDGGQDGGLDAVYVFVNDQLISDIEDLERFAKVRSGELRLRIFSCRHAAAFQIEPVEKLALSLAEILDLGISSDDLASKYNDAVIEKRELFMEAYRLLAHLHPSLVIDVAVISRGDDTIVSEEVQARGEFLKRQLAGLFANCEVALAFVGAPRLLTLSRRTVSAPLRLRFTEGPISRGKNDYLVLSKLGELFAAVSDEQGRLRKHLFEANVRDYLGDVTVNKDVEATLLNRKSVEDEDFWWLNNGVTILGLKATPAGKELVIQDARIVNGLQTTETLFNALSSNADLKADERAVLVKVVVSESSAVHDRIIKATNNQSQVDAASLHATDKIQRDIEETLFPRDWFYDRRRHYYRNQGRPHDRIVSPTYLGACVTALAIADPVGAAKAKVKFLRDDNAYRKVFNSSWDIQVFLVVLEFCKQVEHAIHSVHSIPGYWSSKSNFGRLFKFLVAFIVVANRIKTRHLHAAAILAMPKGQVSGQEILDAWTVMAETRTRSGSTFSAKRLHRNREYFLDVLKTLDHRFAAK